MGAERDGHLGFHQIRSWDWVEDQPLGRSPFKTSPAFPTHVCRGCSLVSTEAIVPFPEPFGGGNGARSWRCRKPAHQRGGLAESREAERTRRAPTSRWTGANATSNRRQAPAERTAPVTQPIRRRPCRPAKVVALPRIGGLHHRYEWADAV